MKDFKRKIISELMKNSRRSDREIARAIGITQPTVTRIRSQLEKEGVVKEYTMIPDFSKLDYKILALTIVKLKHALSPEQIEETKKIVSDALKTMSLDVLMLERGLGLESDGVILSCHRDYTAYVEFLELLKRGGQEFLYLENTKTFLIDLKDAVRFVPLTLSVLAHNFGKFSSTDFPVR